MDPSKYPLDKILYLAAGIIPGFVALLTFQLSHPGAFAWFFSLGFLGYKTQLTLILLACFIVGNTITTFLNALLGAVGGMMGAAAARKPYQQAHLFAVAPWRDRVWRTALKNYLGTDTPNDTFVMKQETYDFRRKLLDSYPNPLAAAQALADLDREKLNSEMDDSKWREWYDHFHNVVVTQPGNPDFIFHVQTGLRFNLQATSLVLLIGALFVPAVRHWWTLVTAGGWSLLGFAEVYTQLRNTSNHWSTLTQQVEYLRRQKNV